MRIDGIKGIKYRNCLYDILTIPHRSGVYCLINEENQVIYCGKAADLQEQLKKERYNFKVEP